MHRGTGIVISLGALVIAAWLWSVAMGGESYECMSWLLTSTLGKLFLVIWSACTSYHLLNGIRHLFWDAGFGFELDQAYLTGKLVLILTVVLTLAVWLI
jgi:succinate dehydrogenase / fumarate reductase cytochrome b subunit